MTVMMIDVAGSSATWVADPAGTARRLDALFVTVRDAVTGNSGLLVKCIGDAFMATFYDPEDAIRCAVQLQVRQRKTPSRLRLRIGMAHGPVLVRRWEIQGCGLLDLFGNTVNTAARIESKVSVVGGFGFGFCWGLDGKGRISKRNEALMRRISSLLLAGHGEDTDEGILPPGTPLPHMTRFVHQVSKCDIGLERSRRLVPFSMLRGQHAMCKPSRDLRGVSPVDVFSVDLGLV